MKSGQLTVRELKEIKAKEMKIGQHRMKKRTEMKSKTLGHGKMKREEGGGVENKLKKQREVKS
ncbi:hypothetical protein E2C01_067941 [Portunus trituberculatus]|uniref:Uncharacterized protein n=1 Tax=Portunus trituberculatus TaxID=210409 RepID=A0A5B7HV76_PORTR|nr:hypothetical protein [Portunus trituberculatus]